MRTILLAALAALLIASAATAAPDTISPEGALYRATYAEISMRDFATAVEEYTRALIRSTEENRTELAARALVGRARCLAALGRSEEAIADLKAAVGKDPEVADAHVLLGKLEAAAGSPGVEDRLRALVAQLRQNPPREQASQARQDLALAGDAAIPALTEGLRSRNAATMTACASILVDLGSEPSLAALREAFEDPGLPHVHLVRALGSLPASPDGIRVFEAAFGNADPGVRLQVLGGLALRAKSLADQEDTARSLRALVARAASDENSTVRHFLLTPRWPDCVAPPLVPIARELLESQVPSLRLKALKTVRGLYGLRVALSEDLMSLIREDPSAKVRREALETLTIDARPLDRQLVAVLGAMGDPDLYVVRTALNWFGRHREVYADESEAILDALLVLGRRAVSSPPEFGGLWSLMRSGLFNVRPEVIRERAPALLQLAEGAEEQSEVLGRQAVDRLVQDVLSLLSKVPGSGRDEVGTLALKSLSAARSRAGCVRWLARPDSEVPGLLALAASDPEPAVRWEAYASIRDALESDIDLPDLPHLERDLRDDGSYHAPEVLFANQRKHRMAMSRLALALLSVRPSEQHVDLLRTVWRESEGQRRTQARQALVSSIGKKALPEVRADLEDPRYAYTARHQLRMLIDAEAAPEFVKLAVERESAMDALRGAFVLRGQRVANGGTVNRPVLTATAAFIEAFVLELPDDLVSAGLIDLAAGAVSPSARRKLLLAGLRSDDPDTVRQAAERAGAFNLVESWPRLVEALDGPHVEVRRAAKAALEEIRAYRELKAAYERFGKDDRDEALAMARKLLGDADPVKRRGAAYALGALGDPSAVPALLKLLGDDDESVREAALAALERLGGRKE